MKPLDAHTRLQEVTVILAVGRPLPPARRAWLVPARSLVVLAAQTRLGHLNAEQLAAARAIVAASVGTARGCVQSGLIEVLGDTHPRGHGDGAD